MQNEIAKRDPSSVDDILTIPLAKNANWSEEEKREELDESAQSILGYVVRWIDAMPQYGPGHAELVSEVRAGLPEGVALTSARPRAIDRASERTDHGHRSL